MNRGPVLDERLGDLALVEQLVTFRNARQLRLLRITGARGEADQEQGADEDAEIEEATVKPKRKNPKSDMEERRRRFPELRPYLGNVTGGEDEFDMEERLRKFPELGPYQG